ncbi:MAG: hypothetical protein U5L45_23045 [Saprospiraceae bacterium]|nr:hypothetical protein [Saprospiraceae bacterium]
MTNILSTAKNDSKLAYNQQLPSFINTLNYKLPLIRKLEFKAGADNFDLAGQQYALAISPNTFGQMKRQAAIKAVEINRNQAESSIFIHEALIERYQALLEINYINTLKQKQKNVETLLNQKNTTLKSMIQRGLDVRIKDIADTENDRYALQLSLLQLEINAANNHEKLRQFMGTNNEILVDFEQIVRVKDVEKNINSIKNNKTIQTPEIQLAKTETKLKKAELNLENASNKEVLSTIQIVDAPRKNDPFNNFGVRFTLNIPLFDNNRLKKNELAIDVKKAENKEQLLSTNNQKLIKYQIVSIENNIKKYRIYADKADNSLIKSLLDNTKLTAEMSALELLDLKLSQQKTELELIKIEYTIMQEYLDLLSNTDLLEKIPYKNYLSSRLEVF